MVSIEKYRLPVHAQFAYGAARFRSSLFALINQSVRQLAIPRLACASVQVQPEVIRRFGADEGGLYVKDRTKVGHAVPSGRHAHDVAVSGRERLLDAAIDLFANRGIANTTVAQIAVAAEVTPAMVHYWFETREKLYDAIVEERLVPQVSAIWRPVDMQRESALEMVQGLLARMFRVTAEAPWLPSLWLREIIQVGGLLQARVLSRIPHELGLGLRRKIAESQAHGEMNPQVDPNLIFISMLALVMLPQAAAQGWHKARSAQLPDRERIEAHVSALLMNGLMPTMLDTPDKAMP